MILACHNLSKSFGDQVIVKDGSFHIENHEKAALVGLNGAGKSTILKMIVGQLSPDAGTVVLTKGKTLGYLAQHQEMESGNTIYEEVRTAKAEVIEMERQIRTIEMELPSLSGDALEARLATYQRLTSAFEHADGYAYKSELTGVLKGLGFTEEEFTKPVDSLSGGQKTRVSLGKLLLTKPDVLLLDEPTNHLDMNSIAWLETYLLNYPGAVFIVSHDRYFINKTATRILDLTGKRMMNYIGNYDYYLEKHEAMMNAHFGTENVEPTGGIVGFGASKTGAAAETSGKAAESSADAGGKLDWKAQKEEQARQRKRQNDLKKVEDEIHRLETRDCEIDGLLCDESVFSDVAKLMELNKEKEEIAGKLETLYEKWEELAE